MKILFLAIAILVLATGIVLWESQFVTGLTTSLIHIAEQMPSQSIFDPDYPSQDFDTFQQAYQEFQKTWNGSKHLMYLFVGHTEADKIDSTLQEAGMRYLSEDIPGYRSARKKLIAELEKLRDLEKLSFDSFT